MNKFKKWFYCFSSLIILTSILAALPLFSNNREAEKYLEKMETMINDEKLENVFKGQLIQACEAFMVKKYITNIEKISLIESAVRYLSSHSNPKFAERVILKTTAEMYPKCFPELQ